MRRLNRNLLLSDIGLQVTPIDPDTLACVERDLLLLWREDVKQQREEHREQKKREEREKRARGQIVVPGQHEQFDETGSSA